MSTNNHSCLDTLNRSYVRESGAFGPTRTATAAKTFAQRLRGVLSRINAAIRRAVIERDIFNLSEQTDTLEVEDPPTFETDTNPQRVTLFVNWLREQLDTEFLTIVGPDRNQWLEKAYAEGIRNVHRQLSELDIAFTRTDASELITAPLHLRSLQELYTRSYENLQSVRSDVVNEVRLSLLDGFKRGLGPREMADNLTDRVGSIGKHRSTMIARSEVINAHSTGTLTRIDEINENQRETVVASHGVWDAANDSRTCAFCRALDGVELTTDEMEGGIVTIGEDTDLPDSWIGQTLRLKPPAHPNGRCNIRVSIGTDAIESPVNDRLPTGIATNG